MAEKPVGDDDDIGDEADVRDAHCHQDAVENVELPQGGNETRNQQPRRENDDAERHHPARAETVKQPSDQRAASGEDQHAEGKSPGRIGPAPVELLQDGHVEDGEGPVGGPPDGQREEADPDNDPTIEKSRLRRSGA